MSSRPHSRRGYRADAFCCWVGSALDRQSVGVVAAVRRLKALGVNDIRFIKRDQFLCVLGVVSPHGDAWPQVEVLEDDDLVVVGTAYLDIGEDPGDNGVWETRGPRVLEGTVELVARVYAESSVDCFHEFCGDFALIVWDAARNTLFAARDWMGLQRLFWRNQGGVTAVASHAYLLMQHGDFDDEYVADFLCAFGRVDPARSIWLGVSAIEPGTYVRARPDGVTRSVFLDPWTLPPARQVLLPEAAGEFRRLFLNAVEEQVATVRSPWILFSGGVDSSSIAVAAKRLSVEGRLRSPVHDAVTWVDSLHPENQEPYYDAVEEAAGLRINRLRDYYGWADDDAPPPITDEPRPHIMFWARNRATRELVRRSGGGAILGGDGADHYLTSSVRLLADLVTTRWPKVAIDVAVAMAVDTQQSLWHYMWKYGLRPLLPLPIRTLLSGPDDRPPPWIAPSFARHVSVDVRLAVTSNPRSEGVGVFGGCIRRSLQLIRSSLEVEPIGDSLPRRYPFMHRSILKFILTLADPFLLASNPGKQLLREAMADDLPEVVRRRRTNTTIGRRFVWSIQRQAGLLERLTKDPIVAQYGWVDPQPLRAAVADAQVGKPVPLAALQSVLALETWLRISAGEWSRLACRDKEKTWVMNMG